jgi:hypothetical protein
LRVGAARGRHAEVAGAAPFAGDDERVFANPRTGRPFGADRYTGILRMALDKVGIEESIRPSHDLRHSSITNAAAGTRRRR